MTASLPIRRLDWAAFQLWTLGGKRSGLLPHRDDGKSFVVRSEEKLAAFLEVERVTRESLRFQNAE
jgi:hypothetical protein